MRSTLFHVVMIVVSVILIASIVFPGCNNAPQETPENATTTITVPFEDLQKIPDGQFVQVFDIITIEEIEHLAKEGEIEYSDLVNYAHQKDGVQHVSGGDVELDDKAIPCKGAQSCELKCGDKTLKVISIPDNCSCSATKDCCLTISCPKGCPAKYVSCSATQ